MEGRHKDSAVGRDTLGDPVHGFAEVSFFPASPREVTEQMHKSLGQIFWQQLHLPPTCKSACQNAESVLAGGSPWQLRDKNLSLGAPKVCKQITKSSQTNLPFIGGSISNGTE